MYQAERSCPMNFFCCNPKKIRELPKISDDLNVVILTKKELSEEQRDAIITVVKDGTMSGELDSDIAILINMCADINDMVVLNRTNDGIEVII